MALIFRGLGGLAAAAAVSNLPRAPHAVGQPRTTPSSSMCEGGTGGGGSSGSSGSGGALYLSSGPSGAGKDTLLLGARKDLRTEEVGS